MKFLIFLLFNLTILTAQELNIYYENTQDKVLIYANNSEYSPISVELDFEVDNLKVKGGDLQVFVVEALKNKQLLTTLEVIKPQQSYKFSYQAISNYGNHLKSDYDKNYVYQLPYKKGEAYRIGQGYFGKFSHHNEYSLDFDMPLGTEISAIREGIVVKVIDHHSKNCSQPECKKFNNSILIYHEDGSFAEYAHIQQNSAKVKAGEKIYKGQIIALSGDVGYTTGPHLHLVIFMQKLTERETFPTYFHVDDDRNPQYLVEGKTY